MCSHIPTIYFTHANMLRIATLFIVVALFLVGCATRPIGPQHPVNLSSQLQRAADISTWTLRGKMAFISPESSLSATVNWNTDELDFNFRLTNVLGVTLVNLSSNDGSAVLKADGNTYEGSDPAYLIYQASGLTVPVNQLLFWMKGLPLREDTYTVNDKGLLKTLEGFCYQCEQWSVSYQNYMAVENEQDQTVWLPRNVTLTSKYDPNTRIKIKVYQWTIN